MSGKPKEHVLIEIPRSIGKDERRTIRETAAASDHCVEYNDNYLVVENNRLGVFYINKLLKILGKKHGNYGVNAFWLDRMSSSDFIDAIDKQKDSEQLLASPIKKPRSSQKSRLRSIDGFRRSSHNSLHSGIRV